MPNAVSPLVFVTHDLGVVSQVAERVAVMYTGRFVETGPTAESSRPRGTPTRAGCLAAALDVDSPDREPVAIPGSLPDPLRLTSGCSFHPRCQLRDHAECTTSRRPARARRARAGGGVPALRRPLRRAGGRSTMSDALIEVDDLSVSFRSEHGHLLRAVDDVTLRIAEGEVLGLVGESGCGKTTIAKCIAGRIAPTSGVVRFDGRELGARRATEDRRAIQMVFQDPYSSLNPRMTVRHVLSELLKVHRLGRQGGHRGPLLQSSWRSSASHEGPSTACRASSPGASDSGSPSPGRSRWSPA